MKIRMNEPVRTQEVVTIVYRKDVWPIGETQSTSQTTPDIPRARERLIKQGYSIVSESAPWMQEYIDVL